MKIQFILFLIIVLCFKAQGQTFLKVDSARFIEWQEDRPLTWDDFKVRKTKKDVQSLFALTSVFHSVRGGLKEGRPNFEVKVLYVKKDSWTTSVTSQRLLAHEQLHFDLAELYGRKIRNDIDALGKSGEDNLRVYKKRIKRLLDEFNSKSELYDRETQHGRIKEKQEEWQLFVEHELQRLNKYK